MVRERASKGKTAAQKPKALPVCPGAIPAELKALPRWVVWGYVPETDPDTGEVDWDKPPVNARTGGPASSTNKKTWRPFAEALAAYERGGWDGIGFVLNGDGDLVGVDLDKCRNLETGALEPWAREIIGKLNTYAEVSPSGRGVRLFLCGQLPPEGRKRGHYENYATGRYVTVTGQRIEGTPATIERRQEELLQVHRGIWPPAGAKATARAGPAVPANLDDAEVIRRMTGARNGGKAKSLWNGEIPAGKSHSEADLALCNYIAFWCGPSPDRIDTVFRQSGLFRSKWQRDDYRERTIAKALAGR
jgi:primase-polymerase (primpol)-like protein